LPLFSTLGATLQIKDWDKNKVKKQAATKKIVYFCNKIKMRE
jgi:hypothetical protein